MDSPTGNLVAELIEARDLLMELRNKQTLSWDGNSWEDTLCVSEKADCDKAVETLKTLIIRLSGEQHE